MHSHNVLLNTDKKQVQEKSSAKLISTQLFDTFFTSFLDRAF